MIKKWKVVILLCICMVSLTACGEKGNTKLGLQAYDAGNYTEAVECFQAAILEKNTDVQNYIYQGMSYIALEKYDSAKQDFHLAQNLDSSNKMIYRGLGIINLKKQEYDQAIDCFNQAITLAGHTISETEYDVLRYRAEAEQLAARYTDAVNTYTVLLNITKPDVETYYNRGSIYAKQGEIVLAKQDFDAAISFIPDDYRLYWNIYNSLLERDEQAGKEYLERALTISNQSSTDQKYQGIVQYLLQDYENAIQTLTTLSDVDLESQEFLALAYESNGDFEDAQAVYQQLIEDNKNSSYVYNQMALYLLRQNSGKEALKYIKKGITVGSNEDAVKVLYYNEIIAYEKIDKYGTALKKLQEYTENYEMNSKLKKEEQFLLTRVSED